MQRSGIARLFCCLWVSATLALSTGCTSAGPRETESGCAQKTRDLTFKLKVKTQSADDLTPVDVDLDDEDVNEAVTRGTDPRKLRTCPGYLVRWVLKTKDDSQNHEFKILLRRSRRSSGRR